MSLREQFRLHDHVNTVKGAKFVGRIIGFHDDEGTDGYGTNPGATVQAEASEFKGMRHVYPLVQLRCYARADPDRVSTPATMMTIPLYQSGYKAGDAAGRQRFAAAMLEAVAKAAGVAAPAAAGNFPAAVEKAAKDAAKFDPMSAKGSTQLFETKHTEKLHAVEEALRAWVKLSSPANRETLYYTALDYFGIHPENAGHTPHTSIRLHRVNDAIAAGMTATDAINAHCHDPVSYAAALKEHGLKPVIPD